MSHNNKWKSSLTGRDKTIKVKSARGRKNSSTRWLQRQLNDPYVQEAQKRGFRSRAAFKLIELDDRFQFLKPGMKIVDLGCAPGGWTQVAAERIEAEKNPNGHVIGIDLQEVEDIPGATILQGDFMELDAPDRLKEVLGGSADIVLSDMAAAASGHTQTDHIRIIGLVEIAILFAEEVLKPGGWFIAKVLQGGMEGDLLNSMKRNFKTVRHAKPPASRKDSAEMYVVASGFRGKNIYTEEEA
jgi:23S rRNA (uridine2552-2'-O)-methyltransferase